MREIHVPWYYRFTLLSSFGLTSCALPEILFTILIVLQDGQLVVEKFLRLWDIQCLFSLVAGAIGIAIFWGTDPSRRTRRDNYVVVTLCLVFSIISAMITATLILVHMIMMHHLPDGGAKLLKTDENLEHHEDFPGLVVLILTDLVAFICAVGNCVGTTAYLRETRAMRKDSVRTVIYQLQMNFSNGSTRCESLDKTEEVKEKIEKDGETPEGVISPVPTAKAESMKIVRLSPSLGTVYSLPPGSLILVEKDVD
ncbi:uncharacterized protein LOC143226468 [Tachypleus tridentatus]|uniref:uncharacterized protein LOC143226468 n=1 Tax=Tachypleus tridentatus TaxID=6853 RepID=UPI003FCF3726